jgi:protein involved in polysaccharide export with SLBB domain
LNFFMSEWFTPNLRRQIQGGVTALGLLAGFAMVPLVAQDSPPPPRAEEVAPVADPVAVRRTTTGEVRENLKLKTGDIVSINVFGEPSLTGAFTVGPGGEIVFPLLGTIPAAGSTAVEVGERIKTLLETDYIRSAQVAVAIAEEAKLAPNTVTVIGQVMRPGQVAFEKDTPMDLFTAISTAGGLTERGDRNRIELKRRAGDDLRTQSVNLDRDRVLKLSDKDTIIVHALPEKIVAEKVIQTVTVIGEVKQPGQVPLKDDQPLDIITAIAMSGGFTDVARPSRVVVRRNTEAGVQSIEVNVSKMQRDNSQPFLLQPNDTVTVPQSVF